ncbi:hypothetical protein HK098_006268 [Nowakowskiella sp. JEL0407]|nr:hypothetical protein HK098_006268 [Nowakowskiella sp. JEL0407]
MLSEQSNGSTVRTQLSPSTAEFANLEYGLQMTLKSSTARIVAAYAISNPHLTIQFEKRCRDMLVLTSWVDTAQLHGANSEEEVIRRGFQFTTNNTPSNVVSASTTSSSGGSNTDQNLNSGAVAGTAGSGMSFVIGNSLRSVSGRGASKSAVTISHSHQSQKIVHKVLVCKVGIGRAHVCDDMLIAEKEIVPEGYDSFYLREQSVISDGKTNDYFHTYFIKNPAQILPQYIVHYEFDPVKEQKCRERAKCDNCEQAEATVHCAADAANLCNKCDGQLHSTKLSSRHVRTPIGKGADVFGYCRHHPDKLFEFFCSQCHIPVCVYCKMVGNHANGEAAKHQLVSVTEAYQSVLTESQTHDPILQSRRTEINNQIAAIHSRGKAVEKMAASVEAHIEEMYHRALDQLKSIIRKKHNILIGDELELKRQLGEIDSLESFVSYMQSGDATSFLFSWARQQHYRAELHDFKFFKDTIDVPLDVKVTGTISVVSDPGPGHHSTKSSPTKTTMSVTNNHQQSSYSPPSPSQNSNNNNGGNGNGGLVSGMQKQQSYMGHGGLSRSVAIMSGNGGNQPLGQRGNEEGLGMGIPRKLQERTLTNRTQRRTSDFFSEALGAFDTLSIQHDDDDGE